MCNIKSLLLVCIFGLILLNSESYARKQKKPKRQKEDQDSTTFQPDIVTYSMYEYTDSSASNYDGFVPSSPDYASYLSNYNHETTTRLYAPAFPTAMDNTAPEVYGNQHTQSQEVQNYGSADGQTGTGVVHYPKESFNLVDPPNFSNTGNPHLSNIDSHHSHANDEMDDGAPIYGTKLTLNKNKNINQYNNNTNTIFNAIQSTPYLDIQHSLQPSQQIMNEQPHSVSAFSGNNNNYRNAYNYAPTYAPTQYSEFKPKLNPKGVSFQKVLDFTKHKFQYPAELDNQYSPESTKSPEQDLKNEEFVTNSHKYNPNENTKFIHKEISNYGNEEKIIKPDYHNYQDHSFNQLDYSSSKYNIKNNEVFENNKDKVKSKFVVPSAFNKDYSSWKNAQNNFSNLKANSEKNPMQNDYDSASSNVVDLTNFNFPKHTYSVLRDHKIQQEVPVNPAFEFSYNNDWKYLENFQNYMQNFEKSQNSYTQSPATTTTSYWGNNLKGYSTASSFKDIHDYKKPPIDDDDDNYEDVVHIPKKTQKYKYNNYPKHTESKTKPFTDWNGNIKLNSLKFALGNPRPIDEWNKEMATRFKSEEYLLGLRTKDTSHPLYLPTFKLNSDIEDYKNYASNYDYKNAIEKWRQSYIKSKKYKSLKYRDPEGMGSEMQSVHVPIPKPYPVEVPHPVIVPVPQPYPVRVPVPRPVAVPVVRELTVPVEKLVPYPVIKNVPYPIEKLVPVPVEKTVQVPVEKPYPVPIPHVRPVFHHSRPTREYNDAVGVPEFDQDFDDDFFPPRHAIPANRGTKRIVLHTKKHKSSRGQPRRPYQTTYQDRTRRRWPPRRATPTSPPRPRRQPRPQSQTRYQDHGPEHLDHDHGDYFEYCRNGNC